MKKIGHPEQTKRYTTLQKCAQCVFETLSRLLSSAQKRKRDRLVIDLLL